MLVTYERDILLVENPVSTNAPLNRGVIDAFKASEWGSACIEEPTIGPDYDENIDHLTTQIKSGMLVVSLGGDGQANIVGNAVITASEHGAEDVQFLAMPTGRTNDWSLSVYGEDMIKKRSFLRYLGDEAQALPFTTIEVEKEYEGRSTIRHAQAYYSAGASAAIAATYGSRSYREGRYRHKLPNLVRDGSTMLSSFIEDEAFKCARDGETLEVHELAWTTIERLALVMRWAIDSRAPTVIGAEYPKRFFPLSVLGRAATRGIHKGIMRTGLQGEPLEEPAEFTVLPDERQRRKPLRDQFDGEASVLAAGTKISVKPHHAAFVTRILKTV